MVAINQVNTFGQRVALENASEKTAEKVDEEIKHWLDTAYKDAKNLVLKNKATVDKLAKALLDKETLTGEEIREIVFGKKAKKTHKKVARKTDAKK
ncbi:MAG: hypothetical protein IJQ55_01745, partial [Alphaproteobacteria bacterium]|nr:hypothetical protein [Alphaproteobacteria bacterium]